MQANFTRRLTLFLVAMMCDAGLVAARAGEEGTKIQRILDNALAPG